MLVEHEGKATFIPSIDVRGAWVDQDPNFDIIFDRKLTKPGDTLHVKGEHRSSKRTRVANMAVPWNSGLGSQRTGLY